MTHRERFIKTLKCEPIGGQVPTFELVFFLTMEKFGKVHPCLLYTSIQMQKLLFVGRLHFRKELLGGRQEFFKSGFVAAHDRTVGQKPHGPF